MVKNYIKLEVGIVISLFVISACFLARAQTPDPVVNIPALVGLSPEEVEKTLGKKPSRKYSGPRLQYYDEWHLYRVGRRLAVYFRQNKAIAFNCSLKQDQYAPTPEGALQAVGIEVKGAPPGQSEQTPWPAPGDIVFSGSDKKFLWSGIFNGVDWGALYVYGNNNRFNGNGFSKDYWRVKSKYFMVAAFAKDLEVPGR